MDNNFPPLMLLPSPTQTETTTTTTSTTTALVVVKNPRKKRTPKTAPPSFQIHDGAGVSKPKPTRKPDPFAPKITRPCTECGRKFWSWKALFGHMRCHPERQWRGINPPPNIRRRVEETTTTTFTDEDLEVANCLLLLSNGPTYTPPSSPSPSFTTNQLEYYSYNSCSTTVQGGGGGGGGFECSSCKKVFGSHQALGGHRASHKNVKGCYAINKNYFHHHEQDEEEEDQILYLEGGCSSNNNINVDQNNFTTTSTSSVVVGHHECSICFRVFSSGQALGGHKRCHWEKTEEDQERGLFDLNYPATTTTAPMLKDDMNSYNYSAAEVGLDLRLGI